MSEFESASSEYLKLPISLHEILIDHPTSTFWGEVVGQSMESYGIFSGDVLIVCRAAAETDLDIIVCTLNTVYMCKLFDRKKKRLISGNAQHKTYQLDESDDFLEEGIVIHSIRNHRRSSKLDVS